MRTHLMLIRHCRDSIA